MPIKKQSFLAAAQRVLRRLSGVERIAAHEQLILDAWRSFLSPTAQQTLDVQIDSARAIQHQAGGAKVCFYYQKRFTGTNFNEKSLDLHVATVWLRSSGRDTISGKIFLNEGRFFSIEFLKRPTRYLEQHAMDDKQLTVDRVQILVELSSGHDDQAGCRCRE
jgi:hypothetical protein